MNHNKRRNGQPAGPQRIVLFENHPYQNNPADADNVVRLDQITATYPRQTGEQTVTTESMEGLSLGLIRKHVWWHGRPWPGAADTELIASAVLVNNRWWMTVPYYRRLNVQARDSDGNFLWATDCFRLGDEGAGSGSQSEVFVQGSQVVTVGDARSDLTGENFAYHDSFALNANDGTFNWSVQARKDDTSGGVQARLAVVIDSNGHITVGGDTGGSFSSPPPSDGRPIVQYDSAGNERWVVSGEHHKVPALAVDASDRVYVADRGGGRDVELRDADGNLLISNAAEYEEIATVYDLDAAAGDLFTAANGALFRHPGATQDALPKWKAPDAGTAVAAASGDRIYTAGNGLRAFDGSGNQVWHIDETTSAVATDGTFVYTDVLGSDGLTYIRKYDDTGSLVWSKPLTNVDLDSGSNNINGIAVDGSGNVYTTGGRVWCGWPVQRRQ